MFGNHKKVVNTAEMENTDNINASLLNTKVNITVYTPPNLPFNNRIVLTAVNLPESKLTVDAGATWNYVSFDNLYVNRKIVSNHIGVKISYGCVATSIHLCNIDIPSNIPVKVGQTYMFPEFPDASILLVGMLYDNSCASYFDIVNNVIMYQ